jgi:uncharacterized repeat protein (TIGR01451 family)
MKLRKLSALLGAVALTFSVATTALATAPTGHQVTICHATDSDTNQYNTETVDIGSSGILQGGHSDHLGPAWNPTLKDLHIQWGDIIPPYDYTNDEGTFHFDGLNWDAAGQAIYSHGCGIVPDIHVEKTASVATLPAGGGAVTYTYVVTNPGSIGLTNVTVTDDKCSPVTFVSGDSAPLGELGVAESWTFSCTATLTETTTNVATATGHFGDVTVTDTDDATVTVEEAQPPVPAPAIHVEKTPSVTTLPVGGGSVTYTYVVTNAGDAALTTVTVTDDKCTPVTFVSGDDGDDEVLGLTETWTYTCVATLTETTTNVATATGHEGETTVTDTDDATVTVTLPGGGVAGETDTPTAPPTDAIATSTTDAGGSLPILLIVLGIIGLGAVLLTPVRARR